MNIFSCLKGLRGYLLKHSSPAASPQSPPAAASSPISYRSPQEESVSTLISGLNLANFAISSGVLNQLWDAICQTKSDFEDQLSGSDLRVRFEQKELTKYYIIVFVASPITKSCLLEKTELESSSTITGFDFLRSSRRNSSFSINRATLALFDSQKDELSALVARIAKAAESKPFIITGDGIGGSVACLFALQLLDSLDTKKAKPRLCVTFGSHLLGDSGLQRAISAYKTWNSCFLHVVSMDDCFPSLFVQPNHPAGGQTTGHTSTYHPFGRFVFCSNSGGTCFESPESASVLLEKISAASGLNEQSFDYGSIITSLRKGLIGKDKTSFNAHGTGSSMRRVSVAAQYLADLFQLQDIAQLEEVLKNEMLILDEKREKLGRTAKDLNHIKVYMTYMEWYKKKSEKCEISYYDSYKNQSVMADFDVVKFNRYLQNYWEEQVKDADQKPQKAEAALRARWLLGGTTYRRMVEPLAIADYYKHEGARNYITHPEGRLKHYELLERWFEEHKAKRNMDKQNTFPPSLTEDSCFWAHVEEAIISCEILNKGESASSEIESLKNFENYVFELIRKYEVSSDIFWEKSSFMKWWKEYEKILDKKLMGTSYTSPLAGIMHYHNNIYYQYKKGDLHL